MANPLALITGLTTGKTTEFKGVVKRDWVATGRIDFATKLDSNADPEQPGEFKLLVEELLKASPETKILKFNGGPRHLKKLNSSRLTTTNISQKIRS
jgi:hypothetical protein